MAGDCGYRVSWLGENLRGKPRGKHGRSDCNRLSQEGPLRNDPPCPECCPAPQSNREPCNQPFLHPFQASRQLSDIEFLDVIAVGAHPDDVEIACGGTLAKLVKQGHRVGIIDLTDGEPTPLSPGPETRLAEAKNAAECLGVHRRITLDLPNRKLFDCYESRVKLATEFRKYRPKVVIGFGDKTPMASPDHWQAMQITDAAVFYSRLTKWDDQFEGTSPHTISAQVYFRLSFEPQTMSGFSGGFTVDIGSTLEEKMNSVRCYETQFPQHKQHVLERIEAVAVSQGAACGYKAGESFVTTRPIGTRNFMQTLLGTPY